MIYKDRVMAYADTQELIKGESIKTLTPLGIVHCHLSFYESVTRQEELVGNRKQALRKIEMIYEFSAYSLVYRDIVEFNNVFYRLLHNPTVTAGMTRSIYTVDILEDINVVIE
jgi:hypothetical protein